MSGRLKGLLSVCAVCAAVLLMVVLDAHAAQVRRAGEAALQESAWRGQSEMEQE